MGDGLIFHLVCLACVTLTIAYDVPNTDKDCSSLVVCTRKTWAEKKGVCASDGNFYNTLCGFKVHRCETGEDIFPVLFTDDQNDCSKGKRERRAAQSSKEALFQRVSLNWQRLNENYNRNGMNELEVTMTLTPDTGSDTIEGRNLWRMGVYASDDQRGSGSKYAYQQNILDQTAMQSPSYSGRNLVLTGQTMFDTREMCEIRNKHPYFCVEMARNDASTVAFTIPIRGGILKTCGLFTCPEGAGEGPVGRYSSMGAQVDIPSTGTRMDATIDITPASNTDRIYGDGLWRVGVFGSRNAQGTGSRNGEVRDILDRSSQRQSMQAGNPMSLSGSFDFPNAADLGCTNDYRYLCFEFAKGDRPSLRFTMQSNVMCREQQSCNSGAGGGNTGGGSRGSGGSSGKVARYTNLAGSVSARGTRVTADIEITPDPSTDIISGDGLWRVGAFGSTNAQGQGRKNGEVRNILDYFAQRKTLRGDSNPMELSGSFNFPNAADLGCSNAYRYLCFEFDKGESPSTDFTMQSSIMCQERTCESGSTGGSGGSGGSGTTGGSHPTGGSGSSGGSGTSSGSSGPKTVTIRGLAWALDGSSVEASVNLDSNPSEFEGRNLWRMGAYASPSSSGAGRRYDETRQILSNEDRSRSVRSGRPNTFTSSTGLNIRGLGCDEKRYLCLEFGKGPSPSPRFTIQNGNTNEENRVSCKIQQCNQVPQIRVNSVKPTAIEISEGERNEVEFDVAVKFDPADSTSVRGSSLWKVQTWGAKTGGDVNPKVSAADQVLSSFQEDTMVESGSGSEFKFQRISHTFDLTGRKCAEMKFFCVRLQKGRPQPDFQLMARNDDPNRLMGCLKVRCAAPAKPMFTVNNMGIVRDPYSSARAGQNNPMELDINVNYDRATTTDISGDPQWALEVWGSAKKNGKGRKISPSNLELGYLAHQTFEMGGVLRFEDRAYDFDLTNQECQKSKFLCVKLTKTGGRFTLKGKPNSKALTKCTPYSCLAGTGSSGSTPPRETPPRGGGGGGGRNPAELPQVTIVGFSSNIDNYPVRTTPVPLTLNVELTSSAESGVPSGPNLWHVAVYGNSRSDGSDRDKPGYTGNVLTPKQAKTRLTPGGVMNIRGIRFDFPMHEIGCNPYNYLCIEYGKGSSQTYNMVYPPDGMGVACTVQQCNPGHRK